MSYTPTIIINKKELMVHEEVLSYEGFYARKSKKNSAAYKYLYELMKMYKDSPAPTISGVELLICTPDISRFNKSVRDLLQELNVEYTTSN